MCAPRAPHTQPNVHAIIPAVGDSGAHMRGKADRFYDKRFESITDDVVGPGSYEQLEGSLYVDAQKSVSKTSKLRPAFGTTSSQNALPFLPQDTPGPGSYEPLEPRIAKSKSRPK